MVNVEIKSHLIIVNKSNFRIKPGFDTIVGREYLRTG